MIRWRGPYGDTDIPAGQRHEGWSEYTTGAGTFKTRYRDGDSLGAHHWRELAANVNRHVAMSQWPIWQTGFVDTSVTSSDGPHLGSDDDVSASENWYACTVRVRLLESPRRGVEHAPRLIARVRARLKQVVGGAPPPPQPGAFVRLISCAHESDVIGEASGPVRDASGPEHYAEWPLTSVSYPTTPGWSDWKTIDEPRVSRVTTVDPYDALPDVEHWETHLMLAAHSPPPLDYAVCIAAIEVFEELRGGDPGSLTGGIDEP